MFKRSLAIFILIFIFFATSQSLHVQAQQNPTTNPISWSNDRFTLTADDFYIQINDQKFFANDENVEIVSDPGHANYFTIELRSQPRMNMYVYRFAGGTKWYIGEIRTETNNLQEDWLYYPAQEVLDHPNPLQKEELTITTTNPNGNITGTIYFKNVKLTPKFSTVVRDVCPSSITVEDLNLPNPQAIPKWNSQVPWINPLERNRLYDNRYLVNGHAIPLQDGYALLFRTNVVSGEKLQLGVADKDKQDNYIQIMVFDPDGQQVVDKYDNAVMHSWFDFQAKKTGQYYFVVKTQNCAESRITLKLTSLDQTQLFSFAKTPTGEKIDISFNYSVVKNYQRVGKHPVQFILQVPRAISANGQNITYEILTDSGWQTQSGTLNWYQRPQPINKYGLEWWTFFHDGNYLPASISTTPVQISKISNTEFLISRIGNQLAQPYSQTPDGYFPEQHQYVQDILVSNPVANAIHFVSRFSTVDAKFETGESNCQADITQDGIVDISDFAVMKEHFFTNTRLESCDSKYPTGVTPMCRADIDKSGMIEISDYSILVKHFFSQTSSCWQ